MPEAKIFDIEKLKERKMTRLVDVYRKRSGEAEVIDFNKLKSYRGEDHILDVKSKEYIAQDQHQAVEFARQDNLRNLIGVVEIKKKSRWFD